MITYDSFSAVVLSSPGQTGNKPRRCSFEPLLVSSRSSAFKKTFAAKLRATSTTFLEDKPDSISDAKEVRISKSILACPICFHQLISSNGPVLSLTCKKTFFGNKTHIDLIVASGIKEYSETMPASTELFRVPLISFIYGSSWRQNFLLGGFPGPDKEFELIKHYLKPVLGRNIVDASCGSGVFSRSFAKSGRFSLVVALDFSENMLHQCYEFVKQEENFPKEKLILVRADISRLPFSSSSIDAVHAGAALHCWPSPSAAVSSTTCIGDLILPFQGIRCSRIKVAEISRVLRPGRVFVATTYILDGRLSALPFLRPLCKNIGKISGSFIFLAERELEEICSACGLVGFTCTRNRQFVMISAAKPS